MESHQAAFDDLGTPLAEVTFVVVDLETTGGAAERDAITEIGAVRVRAGEILGEFQTLVDPGVPIPAFISVLTGITDSMVATAPRIETALPAFLEFAAGSVLVAHNARFDVGFLKAAAARLALPWPGYAVVDTVHLARQVVTRDEAPNHRLASLARLFHAATTPDHRALHDARATVDVLHGLLERVGSQGVHSLEELTGYAASVPAETRRKRHLAAGLPDAPGVYVFKDDAGRVLYVGKSVSIRSRVRSYFTASEPRRRMREMVRLAASVTAVPCATELEASVRELRLIAEHVPPYNRRSRHPDRVWWVKLTDEAFPRLSIVRDVADDGAPYIGPFAGRVQAQDAVAALHDALPLRQCTSRLPRRPDLAACALFDLGRCGAPCSGAQSLTDYGAIAADAARFLTGDAREVDRTLRHRLGVLAGQERFEEAAVVRDRLRALLRGAERAQQLAPLARTAELVAARRGPRGGWEIVCVRHGRLAGTLVTAPGADPRPAVEALRASAEVTRPPAAPATAASPEESELVLRWLEAPGLRIVALEGSWTCPVGGASAMLARLSDPDRSPTGVPALVG